MERKSGFFEGIIIGSLFGAVLALLFAPTSGKETRKKLKDFVEEHEDLILDTKEKTEEMVKKTKKAIEDSFSSINEMIDEKKKRINK